MRSGHRKKTQNFKTSSHLSSRFDQHKFFSLLKQVGGNPSNWSLKKEWGIFYRMYFNTSWADTRHARICHDFFRRHKEKLLSFSNCTLHQAGISPSPYASEHQIPIITHNNEISITCLKDPDLETPVSDSPSSITLSPSIEGIPSKDENSVHDM